MRRTESILHVRVVFGLLSTFRIRPSLGVNDCRDDHYKQGCTLSVGEVSGNVHILNRSVSAMISSLTSRTWKAPPSSYSRCYSDETS